PTFLLLPTSTAGSAERLLPLPAGPTWTTSADSLTLPSALMRTPLAVRYNAHSHHIGPGDWVNKRCGRNNSALVVDRCSVKLPAIASRLSARHACIFKAQSHCRAADRRKRSS